MFTDSLPCFIKYYFIIIIYFTVFYPLYIAIARRPILQHDFKIYDFGNILKNDLFIRNA